MSGRENIYTNAAIFGLTKREIDDRLEQIIAFSELEEFIDNPVRTYSSGMYMRLAFSVAINVDADVLLIDEILGVGDANFQAKCFNKLREIKARGTTIVIVSHSLGQIEQICERSIWIHEGKIRKEGPAREVDLEYMEYMGEKMQESAKKELAAKESPTEEEQTQQEKKRWGNGNARIGQIRLLDQSGTEQKVFRTGEKITVQLDYHVKKPVQDAVFGIGIFRQDQVQCYGTNTRIDKLDVFDLTEDGTMKLELSEVQLLPGTYTIDLAIECGDGIPVDYYKEAATIQMTSSMGDVGVMRIPHTWG
jgi:ABC-2 type transport system ATP-binding protein